MDTVLINGEWQQGEGECFHKMNPATGKVIFSEQYASKKQAELAIACAREGFELWRKVSFEDRKVILEKYATLLDQYREEIMKTISEETGKPYWESNTEVNSAIAKIDISIKAYHERTGIVSINKKNHTGYYHKPHGVFIVLGPYNFPLHLPNGHIVPALLAGNGIVFKPSEYTLKTAIWMMRLLLEAGVPKGVVHLVSGHAKIGEALLADDAIAGVLFTGSYKVGQSIHTCFAGKVDKLLALEMGGNNPLVIWDVKNLNAACYYTLLSAFISAGQRCTCARRLIIPDNALGDKLLHVLIENIKYLTVGTPEKTPEVFMGPVMHYDFAQSIIEKQTSLIDSGAISLVKSVLLKKNTGLLSPGLLDVSAITEVIDDEIFGPLLQVIRVPTLDAAIKEANKTRYGLAAGLLSDDTRLFDIFAQEVNAGIINFNQQLTGASSQSPFGGIGWSGNHRASAFYAADYCAYPVASMKNEKLEMPENPIF